MKYRTVEILPYTSLSSASGTIATEINVTDPISAFLIEYKNVRGSVTSIEHVAACLTNISLVDGSDVLFSLSGKEAHALAFYDNALPPYSIISNIPTIDEIVGIPYNFGKKLWDVDLAFQPANFKNPILNITHNRALNDASSSADWLRVIALCFDEKTINPQGYLMSKEVDNPPWVANGSKYVSNLPVDFPIRKLLLRGYLDDFFTYQVINHMKLSEDTDKKVPMDIDTSAWLKIVNQMYPRYDELGVLQVTTTTLDNYCTPSFDIAVAGMQVTGATPTIAETFSLSVPFGLIGAASTNGEYHITGYNPHASFPIMFGDQMDLTDWYDTSTIKKLQLIMTGGAAGSASVVSVVAQQLRKY